MTRIDKQLFSTRASDHQELEPCPQCARELRIQHGKHGPFVGCSGYPECDYHRPLVEKSAPVQEVMEGTQCPKCGSELALKSGRYGFFIGCTQHPDCDYIARDNQPEADSSVPCPQCQSGKLISRSNKFGKTFYACDGYPKCKYSLNLPPVERSCPECGWRVLVEKKVRGQRRLVCPTRSCNYQSESI